MDSLSKETLEKEKLLLEIQNLKRPGWQRISFWNFLMPTLIATGTLVLLSINGAFDSKTKGLEAKRDLLALQISQFESQKAQIIKDTIRMSTGLTILKNQTLALVTEKKNLEKATSILIDSLGKKNQYVASVLKTNKSLYDSITFYKNNWQTAKKLLELGAGLTISDIGGDLCQRAHY